MPGIVSGRRPVVDRRWCRCTVRTECPSERDRVNRVRGFHADSSTKTQRHTCNRQTLGSRPPDASANRWFDILVDSLLCDSDEVPSSLYKSGVSMKHSFSKVWTHFYRSTVRSNNFHTHGTYYQDYFLVEFNLCRETDAQLFLQSSLAWLSVPAPST